MLQTFFGIFIAYHTWRKSDKKNMSTYRQENQNNAIKYNKEIKCGISITRQYFSFQQLHTRARVFFIGTTMAVQYQNGGKVLCNVCQKIDSCSVK